MEFSEKEIALLNKWEKMVARRRIICLSFLLILLTGVVTLLLGIRHQVEINILGGFYLLIVVAVAFKYYSEARKLYMIVNKLLQSGEERQQNSN